MSDLLTRYLLVQGTTKMNVLLDQKVPRGTILSLKGVPGKWKVEERFETLEKRSVKRGWNNNI